MERFCDATHNPFLWATAKTHRTALKKQRHFSTEPVFPKVIILDPCIHFYAGFNFAIAPAVKKKPKRLGLGFGVKSLAIPYFRMANCHTIIGAKRFHCRVRDGIGWFTLAMVTKQSGVKAGSRCKAQAESALRLSVSWFRLCFISILSF